MKTKPIVAWQKGVFSQFHLAFFLNVAYKKGAIEFSQLSTLLDRKILGYPEQRACYELVNRGEREGYVEKYLMPPTQPSFIKVTEEGYKHSLADRERLLAILNYSMDVIDAWMIDLYHTKTTSEVNENGPETLFDVGAIPKLHRTLLLHILANHKDLDPITGKTRPTYLFEIIRHLDRYGWRASDKVMSELKNEQVNDGHIRSKVEPLDVISARSRVGALKSTVEFLSITPEGLARLEDDYRSTRTLLVKTRDILVNWRGFLEEMQ